MTALKDKALSKVLTLLSQSYENYEKAFQRIQHMLGGERIFKRIIYSKVDEDVRDYLAEIRYALIFEDIGCQVEIDPHGKQGPDLKIIRENENVIVEITRLRKIYDGPPDLKSALENPELIEYGDMKRDSQKAYIKILQKLRQIGDDYSIIALWNDDQDMEEADVNIAINRINDEIMQGIITLPSKLLFILYGSFWTDSKGKKLTCFPLKENHSQNIKELIKEIEQHKFVAF